LDTKINLSRDKLIDFGMMYFTVPNEYNIENQDYEETSFKNHTVYYTQDLRYEKIKYNEFNILILGELYDVRNPDKDQQSIMNELLQQDFESDDYYNEMSYYNGRFVIFIEKDSSLYLYPDATSLLSCYYHTQYNIVSSHSEILNLILKYIFNSEENKYRGYGAGVLDFSKFDNIYKLNGNHRFNFKNNTTSRFFPLKTYKELSANEIVDKHNNFLINSADYIFNNNKVLFTLTAGWDSRVTLAFFKKYVENIEFFTYIKKISDKESYAAKMYHIDEVQTTSIADNLNLNFEKIYLNNYKVNEKQRELVKKFETTYSPQLINYYSTLNNSEKPILIKSKLYEIAKILEWKKTEHTYGLWDAYPAVKKWLSSINIDENTEEIYRDYLERNQVDEAVSKNVDTRYLFHHESKFNNLSSAIAQETDKYVNTHIIINYREILFDFMVMNYNDKKYNRVHKLFIDKNWPILNMFKVNNIGFKEK